MKRSDRYCTIYNNDRTKKKVIFIPGTKRFDLPELMIHLILFVINTGIAVFIVWAVLYILNNPLR